METLIAPAVNLAILIGVMAYYLRAPIRQFVNERHLSLGQELIRVRELLRTSQGQYDEFSSKLKAIEVETSALREQVRQEALSTKAKIVAEAQKLASGIVADARTSAGGMYDELKNELSSELAGRVLERAEHILRERLTGDDRTRMRNEFSKQVEAVQ